MIINKGGFKMEKKLSANGLNEALAKLASIAKSIDDFGGFCTENKLTVDALYKKDEDIVNGIIDKLIGFLEKCKLGK